MVLSEAISGSEMCIIVQAKECSTDEASALCRSSFHCNVMLLLLTTFASIVIQNQRRKQNICVWYWVDSRQTVDVYLNGAL